MQSMPVSQGASSQKPGVASFPRFALDHKLSRGSSDIHSTHVRVSLTRLLTELRREGIDHWNYCAAMLADDHEEGSAPTREVYHVDTTLGPAVDAEVVTPI